MTSGCFDWNWPPNVMVQPCAVPLRVDDVIGWHPDGEPNRLNPAPVAMRAALRSKKIYRKESLSGFFFSRKKKSHDVIRCDTKVVIR